ncbi:MAG: hypothetical protein M1829_002423 [Trizodia sp. TS-e1964]|nr:MAG: hypothetical protein M1829_002423 [Trizodia sp. TS-e1964]
MATHRVKELQASLSALTAVSARNTQRLDNTYYSILENFSTLEGILRSLREISSSTARLHESFVFNRETLSRDTRGQLEGFNAFQANQAKIQYLATRLARGRERGRSLAERLARVRDRLGTWERKEGDWQKKVSRRLRMFWVILSLAVLLFVFLYLIYRLSPPKLADTPAATFSGITPLYSDGDGARAPPVAKELENPSQSGTLQPIHPRLQVFDEL